MRKKILKTKPDFEFQLLDVLDKDNFMTKSFKSQRSIEFSFVHISHRLKLDASESFQTFNAC